jgi:hypothetical protein
MKKVRILNDWGESYLHLKFKAQNPNDRLSSLGLLTVDEVRVKVLMNQFALPFVRRSLEKLAIEGVVDLYYCRANDKAILEEDPVSQKTWKSIEDGTMFDKDTGLRYIPNSFVKKYALTRNALVKEEGGNGERLTILGRIRRWLRGGGGDE